MHDYLCHRYVEMQTGMTAEYRQHKAQRCTCAGVSSAERSQMLDIVQTKFEIHDV